MELKEFLASDDSESDDDNDNDNEVEDKSARKSKKRDKYRALIQSGDGSDEEGEDEEGQDMEVTFSTGLEDISKRILEKKNKKSESVWEAYLRKRKEKKKASKKGSKYSSDDEGSDTDQEPAEEADDFFVEEPETKSKKLNKSAMQETEASIAELELLTADDNGEDTNNLKGYNLKPKKKNKGKKGKGIPDEEKVPTVDLDDPRFRPLYTSPDFALDPTDPQFKRLVPLRCFIVP